MAVSLLYFCKEVIREVICQSEGGILRIGQLDLNHRKRFCLLSILQINS